MKKIFLLLLSLCFMQASMPAKYHFVLGTYTQRSTEGMQYWSFDPTRKKLEFISKADALIDPSFVAINVKNTKVYTLSESEGGKVLAYDFNALNGEFKLINELKSGSAHPCHVSLHPSEKLVAVSNYTGGSVAVFSLNENGGLKTMTDHKVYSGSGPNKDRQEKPHAHSAFFSADGKNLLVSDLGTDHIYNYQVNLKTGKLKLSQSLSLSAGSGPRHLVFHDTLPYVYSIQELTGRISAFSWRKGQLTFLNEISSLPENFTGKNSSADIHIAPDGKYLYASNRYHDTVVRCLIDQKTGLLKQLDHTPVKGSLPRNFAISPDGKYMIVANMGTDNMVVFRLENGKMIDMNTEAKVSMPVCIKFLND